MSRDPTPAQRQAISARGVDVCVSAGAGSGKTFVLVERFVGLVHDGLDPERILTITFTEKAAREMAERIGEALRGEDGGGRRMTEGAWISTIHGFCARLLREHALEAGVDPAFSVLTDVPGARVRRAAFLAAQKAFRAERPGAYDGLVERVRWGKGRDGETRIRQLVFQLYEETRAAGARLEAVEALPLDALWLPAAQAALDRLPEALRVYRDAVSGVRSTARRERQGIEISELGAQIASYPVDTFRHELYRDLRALAHAARGGGGPLVDALRGLREAAERAAGDYAEGPARALGRALWDLLRRFDGEFRALKAAQSAVDFSDLEELTLDLLEGRSEVREAVRVRFQALLLDEFQDTSRLQQRLVELIRSPDQAFVVGDVKQSIYGFRHAEVQGLLDYEEQVRAQGGQVVALDVSFRTRPEVLQWVDDVFARQFGSGSEVPHQPLRAGCEFLDKSGPSVELLVGRGDSLERARGQEARAVAGRLATVVEGKLLVGTNPLREDTCGQPLRYRDCAILVPATTALRFYERALRERGIPYRVSSGRGFYATREVVDAILLLEVAAAAHADLGLVALLRSPAVGLSDQALLVLSRLRRRGTPLLQVLVDDETLGASGLHPEDLARARAAARLVQLLRGLRGRCSTRELLDVGLEQSGLLDGSLLRGTDVRGFANLQKLLEVVESLEREGASGPGEVAAILKDLRLSGARESEANVSTEDEDAVSVLTVHASKGLEWPLVVVADMGRKRPPAGDPILWSAETGIVPNLRDPELPRDAITPGSLQRLWDRQRERGREESKRLLYVAMTRSRDHLILAGAQNYSRHAAGDWLVWAREALASIQVCPVEAREQDLACGGEAAIQRSHGGVAVRVLEATDDQDGAPVQGPCGPAVGARPLLAEADRIELSRAVQPRLVEVDDERREAAAALIERVRLAVLPAVDEGASVYTVSEVLTWADCPRRALFAHLLGDDSPLPASGWDLWGRGGGRVPAHLLGTLTHELLASPSRPSPARAARRLRQLLLPRFLPERTVQGAAKRALQLAKGFARTPLGVRAERSGEVLREHPFLVSLSLPGDAGTALLRGTLDLAFREAEGWVLADYKTGAGTALEVPARIKPHALQLRLYALAMAELGFELQEGVVSYLAADIECRVRFDDEGLAEVRQQLADFVIAQRELDLPPRPGTSCRRCPHLRGCPAGQETIPDAPRTPALAHRVPPGSVGSPTGA